MCVCAFVCMFEFGVRLDEKSLYVAYSRDCCR